MRLYSLKLASEMAQPQSEKKTKKSGAKAGFFGPKLEKLSDCAAVQESTVHNIRVAYLWPMEAEIAATQGNPKKKSSHTPTLAQQARFCRLRQLANTMVDMVSIERRLVKWQDQNRSDAAEKKDHLDCMRQAIIEQTKIIVHNWPSKNPNDSDAQTKRKLESADPETQTGRLQIMELAKSRFVKMVESGAALEHKIAALHDAIETILEHILAVIKLFGKDGIRQKDRQGIFNPEDIACHSVTYLQMHMPRKYIFLEKENTSETDGRKPKGLKGAFKSIF